MLPAANAGVDVVFLHQPVDALVVDPGAIAQYLRGDLGFGFQQAVVDLARQAFKSVARRDVSVVLDVAHEPDEFRVTFGLCRGLERTVIGAPRDPGNATGLLDCVPVGCQGLNGGNFFFFARSSGEDPLICSISAV